MERETRFELATPTLARSCSTAELFPHGYHLNWSAIIATFFLFVKVFGYNFLKFTRNR